MQKVAASGALVALVVRAYDTVASIVQSASQKAQMVQNAEVSSVDSDAVAADELWSPINSGAF